MTREEAKELYTPKSTYHMKMYFIDKIYDDFENKSCDGCIHHLSANGNIPLSCGECSRFYSDNYEVEK